MDKDWTNLKCTGACMQYLNLVVLAEKKSTANNSVSFSALYLVHMKSVISWHCNSCLFETYLIWHALWSQYCKLNNKSKCKSFMKFYNASSSLRKFTSDFKQFLNFALYHNETNIIKVQRYYYFNRYLRFKRRLAFRNSNRLSSHDQGISL